MHIYPIGYFPDLILLGAFLGAKLVSKFLRSLSRPFHKVSPFPCGTILLRSPDVSNYLVTLSRFHLIALTVVAPQRFSRQDSSPYI